MSDWKWRYSLSSMNHAKCRKKICLTCFRKCEKNLESAQPLLLQRIHEHVIEDLNINDQKVPIGFCDACRIRLKDIATKRRKGKKFDLTRLKNYLAIADPKDDNCVCDLCKIATSNGRAAKKLLKGWWFFIRFSEYALQAAICFVDPTGIFIAFAYLFRPASSIFNYLKLLHSPYRHSQTSCKDQ